jgi:hypothetical protein
MARLYADEGFPKPIVDELRRLGHDILTTQEAGKAGQRIPDADVLAFSISQSRAVLTRNRRHFKRLHAQTPSHSGIVVCTEDDDFLGQASRIHQAIGALASLNNQLIRVNRPQKP